MAAKNFVPAPDISIYRLAICIGELIASTKCNPNPIITEKQWSGFDESVRRHFIDGKSRT
jgi:hypothetical protein